MRGPAVRVLCVIGLAFATMACSATTRQPVTEPPPSDLGRADHVVIVTIDGLRPDAITKPNTPALHRLIEEGAYSLQAQTTVPSITLPSHVSMITGVTPEEHGVTWNDYRSSFGYPKVASLFDVTNEAGMKTGLFSGKKKLVHMADPTTVSMMVVANRNDALVMDDALDFIRSDHPNLVVVHLPDSDWAGHAMGWMSPKQRRTHRETDGLMAGLIETLEEFRRAGETWLLIVTADHGGHKRGHGSLDPIDVTIPWIAWGDGVTHRKLPRVSITATATVAAEALGLEAPATRNGGN